MKTEKFVTIVVPASTDPPTLQYTCPSTPESQSIIISASTETLPEPIAGVPEPSTVRIKIDNSSDVQLWDLTFRYSDDYFQTPVDSIQYSYRRSSDVLKNISLDAGDKLYVGTAQAIRITLLEIVPVV